MTRAFGHELVETCTDPEGDGWTIDGAPASLNEVGDICNKNLGTVNGVTAEPYWSKFDGACIIPTSVSVRRTSASVGKKLNGEGLLSLQSPITSLNKFSESQFTAFGSPLPELVQSEFQFLAGSVYNM